jgi:hypothetical protein
MEINNECCPICLEKLTDEKYLFITENCNHLYHYNCINTYVNSVETILCSCPLCRSEFKTIGFSSIDLNILFDKNKLDKDNIFNILPSKCFIYDNLPISKKLSDFLNIPENCLISRFIIVKKIYKYINDHKLADNKTINCDEKIKNLFSEELKDKNSNKISFMDIHVYLCNHIGYLFEDI